MSLIRPRAVHFCKLIEGRGSWALSFAGNPDINFGLLLEGSCLLMREGNANVLFEAGDFLMLTHPAEYCLTSDPEVTRLQAEPALAATADNRLVIGDGKHQGAMIMPGYFSLNRDNIDLLTNLLPSMTHVSTSSTEVSPFRICYSSFLKKRVTCFRAEISFVSIDGRSADSSTSLCSVPSRR